METKLLTKDVITVVKEIASNLNIDDVKQGSYLNTLVRGLSALNFKTLSEIQYDIDNINVDTADETTLEDYGNKKSIPRLKNQDVSLTAAARSVSLSIDMFKYVQDETYNLFERGDVIYSDVYKITFLEKVIVNTNLKKTYVSCNITLDEEFTLNLKTLDAGTTLELPIPTATINYIKNIKLNIETNLSFSNFNENLEVYRARLKHYMLSENVANKNSIEMLLNNVPYVSQYTIDSSVVPNKIYIMNNDMYEDHSIADYLEQHSIPYAEGSLDKFRGYSSAFEFDIAKKISYAIDIKYTDDYGEDLFKLLNTYLHRAHVLGNYYIISKEEVNAYLRLGNIENMDFEFKIYFYFNGVQFPVPDEDFLEIHPNEYPFLEELTVNGDRVYV